MSENHRAPEVPEVKVRVVECHDGLARITSEELAITHSVKDGILQNACTTRPRVVAYLVRSASFAHRQVDDDKSTVAMLKKNDLHESARQPAVKRDKSHERPERDKHEYLS